MQSDKISEGRLAWLKHESLREIERVKLALLAGGERVYDLSMINPDQAPPRLMQDRLLEASLKPYNHSYAVSRGVRKLRAAFALKYEDAFKVKLDPEYEICATMGSKDAVLQSLMALTEPGDRVLIPAPTYPAYLSASRLAGLKMSFYRLSRSQDELSKRIFQAIDKQTPRVLLLNFPNNPTGITVDASCMKAVADFARERQVFVLNDFVYGEMEFNAISASSLLGSGGDYSGIAEIYSLSKAYNIPGWRVGALCGDRKLVSMVSKLKAQIDYGTFLPIQHAAAAGLSSSEDLAGETKLSYLKRSRLMVKGLERLNWQLSEPAAGASLWARLPEALAGMGAQQFVIKLLSEERVLALPGDIFGEEYGDFVRFALVLGEDKLHEVITRIARFSSSLY